MNAVPWYEKSYRNSIPGWISFAGAFCWTANKDMPCTWKENAVPNQKRYTRYIHSASFCGLAYLSEGWYWLVYQVYLFQVCLWQGYDRSTKDMKKMFVWQAYDKHMTKKGKTCERVRDSRWRRDCASATATLNMDRGSITRIVTVQVRTRTRLDGDSEPICGVEKINPHDPEFYPPRKGSPI